MSFDLYLTTVCNHKIYKESVTLETDRVSLRLSKPLASSNLELYASDNLVAKSNYSIMFDPKTIYINQPRMIILNKKWKSTEDFFEVTYITLKQTCPKCSGLDKIDDISYNVKGDFFTVRNENLLTQNLEKFTITELQSNPFHTFIGTNLVKLLGQRVVNANFLTNKITQEISSTLQVFKSLQQQYVNAKRKTTNGELLDEVENIKVLFNNSDPSILKVDITATAKSGQGVAYTQFMKVA